MDISPSGSVSRSIKNLVKIRSSSEAAFSRLATGQRHARVQDGPEAYFKQKALQDDTDKVASYKAASDAALGLIDASIVGMQAAKSLLTQMKGRLTASKSDPLYTSYRDAINDKAGNSARIKLSREFDSIVTQVESLLSDSSYQGMTLLTGKSVGVVYRSDKDYKINFSDTSSINLTGKYIGTNSWYEWSPIPDIGIFGTDTIRNVRVKTLATSPKLEAYGPYYTVWKPVRLEGNSIYATDPGNYLRFEVTDYSANVRQLKFFVQTFSGDQANDVVAAPPTLAAPRSGLGLFYSYLYDGLATEKGVNGAILDLEKAGDVIDAGLKSLAIQANIIRIRQKFNSELVSEYRLGAQKIQEIDAEEDAEILQKAQLQQSMSFEAISANLSSAAQIADMIASLGGGNLIDLKI